MSSIVVNGDTSGAVTLSAPAVAGTVTVTLPATSGTMLTTASSTGVSGSAISSGTVAEAYGGTGTTTGYYGFKNRIINGAMVFDQRNAGASVTANNSVFGVDRWKCDMVSSSKGTVQQTPSATETGYATRVAAGFTNYLAFTSSAATSVGSTDYYSLIQAVEGLNVTDLAWGTSGAKTVTLSFWAYSSLTGTFGGSIQNSAYSRSYPFSYTISSANTWTSISITIAGDQSGTWLTTNGAGLRVRFSLGTGTTFSGTAGAWVGSDIESVTGATSVVGTNGATFYITGVQLEKGSTATSFDYRPYGTELNLCQRYYQRWNTGTAGVATWAAGPVATATKAERMGATLSTPMRSSPTFNYSNARLYDGTAAPAVTSISINCCTATNMCVDISASGGGLTVGRTAILIESGSTGYVDFSSEL
jgi:hypothetical protein